MLIVTLYARHDCHLCEVVREDLAALQAEVPHRLVEVDIGADPALLKKYLEKIPVIEVGPYRLTAPISRQSLRMTLGAAADRRSQLQHIGDSGYLSRVEKGKTVTGGDRISYWISRHYLLVLNFFMLLYVGLPILAPVLMARGIEGPARVLYRLYSPLCHQFAFRSFFLFGQQPYYPLTEANVRGVASFQEAIGISDVEDPTSVTRLEARSFVGNEVVGYKMALCERDIAIYAALLVFGLGFAVTGRRVRSLHWLAWILVGIGPIGIDGFSQILSQFSWPWLSAVLPYRESTPLLRVLSGSLFGLMTAWFAYPNIETNMRETRHLLLKKFAVNQPGA